ncbi:MAG: Lrp/AsnC family transcriptional regulator [Armatimonadota bacterium]
MKLTERDIALVRAFQGDLPLVARPFAAVARSCGLTEEEVLAWLRQAKRAKLIRRFGAMLRHRQAGVRGNAMVVWRVPEERATELGEALARYPEVTHCYQRPPLPDLPYTHYTMVHAPTPEQCEAVVARMARELGLRDYRVLFTRRELKRTSAVYFPPERKDD